MALMPFHLFESDDSPSSSSRWSSSDLRSDLGRRSLECLGVRLEENPSLVNLIGGDTTEEEEELLRRLAGAGGRDVVEESELDMLAEREKADEAGPGLSVASGGLRPSVFDDWVPEPLRDRGRGGSASLEMELARSEDVDVMGAKLAESLKPDLAAASTGATPISTLVSPSSPSLAL